MSLSRHTVILMVLGSDMRSLNRAPRIAVSSGRGSSAALVALALLPVLLAACGPSSEERAAKREAAAEKARERAAAVYLEAVRPVLESVYDELQPVQDALDLIDDDPYPISDVVGGADVPRKLGVHRGAFLAVPAPPDLTTQAKDLADAIQAAQQAITKLVPAARQFEKEFDQTIGFGLPALTKAVRQVAGQERVLYGATALPSLPGKSGGVPSAPGRTARSQGSYLGQAAHACSPAQRTLDDLPSDTDAQQRASLPKALEAFRSGVTALLKVTPPASDAKAVKTNVGDNLSQLDSAVALLPKIDAALARNDLLTAERLLDQVKPFEKQFTKARAALRVYGSTTCADLLDEFLE